MPVQIDMEMPRSCGDCRFCRTEVFGCVYCDAYGNYGKEISPCTKLQLFAGRKDWCPLVETEDRTWHVVAEGDLPEDDKEVLITYKSKIDGELNVDITSYCEVAFGGHSLGYKDWGSPFPYFHTNNEVITWRELPEPWEGVVK